jgi:hypothetical protein
VGQGDGFFTALEYDDFHAARLRLTGAPHRSNLDEAFKRDS